MNVIQGSPDYSPYNSFPRNSTYSVQRINDLNQGKMELDSGNFKQVLTTNKQDIHYGEQLTAEQKKQVAELKAVEQKVKTHEQAHRSVGGEFAGGINYNYQKGPGGQQYIVGGEVPIQMPKSEDPEKTIQIMEQIRRAALAPANPSSQDMQVASKASQAILEAQSEMKRQENKYADEQHHQDKRNQILQTYKLHQGANMKKPETIFDQSA